MKQDSPSLRPISPDSSVKTDQAESDKVSARDSEQSSTPTININVSVSLDNQRPREEPAQNRPEREERPLYHSQGPPPPHYSKPLSSASQADRTNGSPPSPQQHHKYPYPPPHSDQLNMNAYPTHEYAYAPAPYYNPRYSQGYPPPGQYASPPYGTPAYSHPGPPVNDMRPPYSPVQSYQSPPNAHVVHTDDAATKLTDRVRRKCYNCRTTDTSTWRRSNLTPGKVLCNKCGLFERTHLRPRPEQFPHKRGPMSAAITKSRGSPSTKVSPMMANSPMHYGGGPMGQSPMDPYDVHHGPPRPMHDREYAPGMPPGGMMPPHHSYHPSSSHHNSPLAAPMGLPMSREGSMSTGHAGVDRSPPDLTLPSLSRSSTPPMHPLQSLSYPGRGRA